MTSLPEYKDVWLDRHFPRHPLLYQTPPLPWQGSLLRDDETNKLYQHAANVDLALTECPDLAGLFWWETSRGRLYVIGKMPDDDVFIPDLCRKLTGEDVYAVMVFLQRHGLHAVDFKTVYWGIRKVANRYHRFRFELEMQPEDRT